MQRALAQAEQAQLLGEVPVGAVLLDAEGRELSVGFNRTIIDRDPTAHAEIVALRLAAKRFKTIACLALRCMSRSSLARCVWGRSCTPA